MSGVKIGAAFKRASLDATEAPPTLQAIANHLIAHVPYSRRMTPAEAGEIALANRGIQTSQPAEEQPRDNEPEYWEDWPNTRKAAVDFDVNASTVSRLAKAGKIRSKMVGRERRICPASLQKYLDENPSLQRGRGRKRRK